MVTRRDDGNKSKKGGASLNEEDYFTKLNEQALKKIKGNAPGADKDKDPK